nr:MAG TPA: Protein of unknown function (DUF2630) [Inoviridae sp.]
MGFYSFLCWNLLRERRRKRCYLGLFKSNRLCYINSIGCYHSIFYNCRNKILHVTQNL